MLKSNSHQTILLHHIVAIILLVLIYLPSFSVPFLFDDLPNIVNNPAVHPETLTQLTDVVESTYNNDRVVSFVTFGLNYLVGGLNVFGYHLVNLMLHIGSALFLYYITLTLLQLEERLNKRQYTKGWMLQLAFFTSLLWAVNPVQTQTVTYIVQRMNGLAAFFYLAALLVFLRMLYSRKNFIISWGIILACYLLAVFSKQNAATLPVVLLLAYWLFSDDSKKRKQLVAGSIAVILLSGSIFLLYHYSPAEWGAVYPGRNFSPIERLLTQLRILWFYLGVYLLPLPERLQLVYNPIVSQTILQPISTLLGGVAILFAFSAAFFCRRKLPLISFIVFFYFVTISIESSFLNLELVFLHRLYLPSVLLFLLLFSLIPQRVCSKITPLLIGMLLIFSLWTINRNTEWQQAEKFWLYEVERGEDYARAMNNHLMWTYRAEGASEEIVKKIDSALERATERQKINLQYNKALVLYQLGEYQGSKKLLEQLFRENQILEIGPFLLGKNGLALEQYDAASRLIKQMKLIDSTQQFYAEILQAELLQKKGDPEQAEKLLLELLIKCDPKDVERIISIHHELAKYYLEQNRLKEAYEQFHKISKVNPEYYPAWIQMMRMKDVGGDTEGAARIRQYLRSRGVAADR